MKKKVLFLCTKNLALLSISRPILYKVMGKGNLPYTNKERT